MNKTQEDLVMLVELSTQLILAGPLAKVINDKSWSINDLSLGKPLNLLAADNSDKRQLA